MNATKNKLESKLFTLSEAYAVLKSLNMNSQLIFRSKETIGEGLAKVPKTSVGPKS